MALYVGDGVSLLIELTDPVRKEKITDASGCTVSIDFFAPGKDPKGVPADRATPDVAATSASYDSEAVTNDGTGAWTAYQTTSGEPWVAGKWSFRVRVTGAYQNVEYGSFTLKA